MTQQKWEALSAFLIALVGLMVPVLLYFFPEDGSMIDVLSTAVVGFLGILGTLVAGWITVNVVRVRAEERESIRKFDA
jgi:protein-S-isoprenylcysteine O-methyltransferase Ste14